jgi:hypothetical protein
MASFCARRNERRSLLKQINRASGCGHMLVEVGKVRRTDSSLFADVKVHERRLDRLSIERDRIFELPVKFRRLCEPKDSASAKVRRPFPL